MADMTSIAFVFFIDVDANKRRGTLKIKILITANAGPTASYYLCWRVYVFLALKGQKNVQTICHTVSTEQVECKQPSGLFDRGSPFVNGNAKAVFRLPKHLPKVAKPACTRPKKAGQKVVEDVLAKQQRLCHYREDVESVVRPLAEAVKRKVYRYVKWKFDKKVESLRDWPVPPFL